MERKTIDISLDTLINECFLNKDLSYEHKRYIENVNRENIHDVLSLIMTLFLNYLVIVMIIALLEELDHHMIIF